MQVFGCSNEVQRMFYEHKYGDLNFKRMIIEIKDDKVVDIEEAKDILGRHEVHPLWSF